MSQVSNFVAAIDIGTTKIVAIIGQKSIDGKIEILGFGNTYSSGVRRGEIINMEDATNAIINSVKVAEQSAGVQIKDVYVGIAGQCIKSYKNHAYKFIDSQDSEIHSNDVEFLREQMKKIPLDVGEEIIHVFPQDYIVDNQMGVKNPIGMFGKKLEGNYNVIIGRIASARNIQKCIRRVGLNPIQLILEPLASSEAVLTDDEKEAGVVLADIGGGTTDVAIYYDGTIRHTAVIPFGGNILTNDIKEGCSILPKYAEEVKKQYGSALAEMAPEDKVVAVPSAMGGEIREVSFKRIAQIIQARMDEIIGALKFEIENSGYSNKLNAGIALTGGGSLLKHLKHLVKFRTNMEVRIGFPERSFSSKVNDIYNQPMYSTVIGLLLKGFEHSEMTNNKREVVKEIIKHDEDKEEQEDTDENTTTDKNSKKFGEGFFKTIKDTFLDIFDDKDDKDTKI